MSTYWIGLGANLGDRLAALRAALDGLRERGIAIEAVSPVFETAPQDLADQPSFFNAACRVRAEMEPRELLRHLKALEQELGRDPGGVRFGPRAIDADILWWSGGEHHDDQLDVPHPRLVRRRFAMAGPLAVEPELLLPDGTRLADAFARIPPAEQPVRRMADEEACLH